ncbi:hypothetical protein M378DRAFT_763734 [Amanita muscaria Koide BX008]|uniref:Uncharacterized protein n=1 Tax=Amanita muscaria (strain Koide BX008) TaxID=946122 RepID=A0A0C2XHZ7_AMAMK|nr:hypothetical protein M378DRAFT_763734 [Amanita muscaria Koide BX008]
MWSLTWAFSSDWWRRNSVPGGACLFTHDILQYTPLAFGPASYRPSPLSGVSRSVPLLQEQDMTLASFEMERRVMARTARSLGPVKRWASSGGGCSPCIILGHVLLAMYLSCHVNLSRYVNNIIREEEKVVKFVQDGYLVINSFDKIRPTCDLRLFERPLPGLPLAGIFDGQSS